MDQLPSTFILSFYAQKKTKSNFRVKTKWKVEQSVVIYNWNSGKESISQILLLTWSLSGSILASVKTQQSLCQPGQCIASRRWSRNSFRSPLHGPRYPSGRCHYTYIMPDHRPLSMQLPQLQHEGNKQITFTILHGQLYESYKGFELVFVNLIYFMIAKLCV